MASAEADWRTGKSLNQCIGYMLNSNIYYDVTFRVTKKDKPRDKEAVVTAQRTILIARSSVFEKMFCGDLAETRDVIPITDIDPQAFFELLRFIYTDEAELSDENVMEMMYAANKYLVTGLMSQCENYLERRLNATNAAMLLEQSMLFEAKALQDRCMKIIQEQTEQVLQSKCFLRSSEEVVKRVLESDELAAPEIEVFEACVAWAETTLQKKGAAKTAASMKATLGELLYLVRFPTMSVGEFANCVLPHNLLNDTDTLALFKYFNCKHKPGHLPYSSKPRMSQSSRSQLGKPNHKRCYKCGKSNSAPTRNGIAFSVVGQMNRNGWLCRACREDQW